MLGDSFFIFSKMGFFIACSFDIEVKLNALGMEVDFSLLPEKIQNLISFAKERKVNETSSPPPTPVQWDCVSQFPSQIRPVV